jgi:hypothetical protein
MISFLEFVCEKLMGPPISSRSWRCPFHEDNTPSFSVNPPKQRDNGTWYPVKFRCHAGSCGRFGDEWDLITHFKSDRTYGFQLKLWNGFRAEYEQLFNMPARSAYNPTPGNRGPRLENTEALRFCLAEYRSVIREKGLKWSVEDAGLWAVVWASSIAEQEQISFEEFSRFCASELIASHEARKAVGG